MKRLIPFITALLLSFPASADTPFSTFVTGLLALPLPAISSDLLPLVRAGVPYHLPATVLNANPSADVLYQVANTSSSLSSAGTWAAISPGGSPVAIVNPCVSGSCLGTAIADAVANGRNFILKGGGVVGTSYPATVTNGNIFQTTTLALGPWQLRSLEFDAYSLNLNTGATPGIIFDACMLCDINHEGQIVYSGSSDAVRWAPSNVVPVDNFKVWTSTRTYIRAIGNNGGTPTAMAAFDLTNGGVNSAWFHLGEVNGAGAPGSSPGATDGILLHNPTNSFAANSVTADQIHNILQAGIRSGTAATTQIAGNLWSVAGIFPVGTTAGTSYGKIEWGQGNVGRFGSIRNSEATGAIGSGTGPDTGLGTGLDYESGSNGNIDIAGYIGGYNTAAVNFKAGSSSNLVLAGYTPAYGAAKPFLDGAASGTNNAVIQGSTLFSRDGWKVVTVDASGNQTGGSVLAGASLTVATGASQGSAILSIGGLLITSYNVMSLNGVTTAAGIQGIFGGGSGPDQTTYLAGPAGAQIRQSTNSEATFNGGTTIGTPTGGAKGIGTLNVAGAVYANGTIGATCPAGIVAGTVTTVGGIITHC